MIVLKGFSSCHQTGSALSFEKLLWAWRERERACCKRGERNLLTLRPSVGKRCSGDLVFKCNGRRRAHSVKSEKFHRSSRKKCDTNKRHKKLDTMWDEVREEEMNFLPIQNRGRKMIHGWLLLNNRWDYDTERERGARWTMKSLLVSNSDRNRMRGIQKFRTGNV